MITTIGLETHVQLDTRTKIFCGCEVKFASPPNSLVCPVCLGLPGVLPVLNREAFLLGLRAVIALNGAPSAKIKFDRKNYFYPDLPKGYQISQYDLPLGRGGWLEIGGGRKIRLHRVHLEEDAGKMLHDQLPDASLVDLNRAGTPLLEIVTEPDLESADEAYEYLVNLKALLKAAHVSGCDMEKGQLRCDANVSVRKSSADPLGTKVEIKNLNSFKAVRSALRYEIERQTHALESGERIAQETRLWDEGGARTHPMRSKEEAHDYRYFPEPDLVPFFVSDEDLRHVRESLPELPRARAARFVREYGLTEYDTAVLTRDEETADFFEKATSIGVPTKTAANWLTGAISAFLNERNVSLSQTRVTPALLAALIELVQKGAVSLQIAKEKVMPDVLETGRSPAEILREKGLEQVSEESLLERWVAEAIEANPKVVVDFKSGKQNSAMFLVGQVMKKSQGKANPGRVRELVVQKLGGA